MRPISALDFFRKHADQRPQGVTAFCGPETYLRNEALEAVKRALAGTEGDVTGGRYAVDTFQVGENPFQEISAAVSQSGLFGGARLVVVDGIERLTRVKSPIEREAWLSLVRGAVVNPMVLMSALHSRELSRRSKFLASLLGAVRVIEFWNLFPRDAARWIVRQGAREGLQVDPSAAGYLIEHLGCDLGILANEVQKLALLKGEGRLTRRDLRALVRAGVLGSSWECVEAILRADAPDAIRRLQGVRREEASFSFLWKLTSATRNALTEGQDRAGRTRGRQRTPPGEQGSGARIVTSGGVGSRKRGLARLLDECYEWERSVKQGRWLGAHDFVGLETLAAAYALRTHRPKQ